MFEALLEKVRKKYDWYDYSLLKISCLAFGLWLAIVWPAVLDLGALVYFVIFAVLVTYLIVKMFK